MSKKTIFLFLIICCCFATNASAEVSFTNDIEMSDNLIMFTVREVYTAEDALAFREDLDADGDINVSSLEIEAFKERYLSNGGMQFLEYIVVDDGSIQLIIDSIELDFENAEGIVDDSALHVSTRIVYLLNSTLSSGEHKIWVLGDYRIDEVRFVLPTGVVLVSYDGLENASESMLNKKVVLVGKSGVTSQMVDNVQRIESASIIWIKKEPFYEHRLFLPLLILVEVLLAATALYIIKRNKNK